MYWISSSLGRSADSHSYKGEHRSDTADTRMFSANLTDDVRAISEDIVAVSDKIDDPVLCQKIEQYAMAPFEIQEMYRKDAGRYRSRLS